MGPQKSRVFFGDTHSATRLAVADLEHLLDGSDAGDRILGELADAVAESADQLAVDVDGAAAHAGDDASVLRLFAVQASEDHVLAGADGILQHAKDFDVHGFGRYALEDGVSDAAESAVNFSKREKLCPERRRDRKVGD